MASAKRTASGIDAGGGPRLRDTLVIGVAIGIFGVSYGVLAVAAGLSPAMACASSLLVFAGGAQFAAVGVVAAGGSPAAAVASGLLLNTRYAALGLAIGPRLGGGRARRALAAHLLIDESCALALRETDDRAAQRAFWTSGATIFVLWNLGTAAGAFAGGLIGDPAVYGLDAAFPAGFLALLAPLLSDARSRAAAAGGVLVAVALVPLAPPGVPVLAAAAGILAGLALPAASREGTA